MISIKNVSFSYPNNQLILKNVEMSIAKGSLFGLLGPNGAGKSTLISIIVGLLEPEEGSVAIDAMLYRTARTTILSKLAVVPQDHAFYLQLTALENLEFFANLYRNNPECIQRVITLTGLEEHKFKLTKQLSGGLKRRLNLAIGLLNEPEILILDEPTVGIDPQSRHFILQAIRDINRQGTTVIYTSHYMEEIEQLCDVVAIMDHGKILRQGNLNDLLKSEHHLLVEVERDQNALSERLRKSFSAYGIDSEGEIFKGELSEEKQLKYVLELFKKNNIKIIRIRYGKQSLESLFFGLTNFELRD